MRTSTLLVSVALAVVPALADNKWFDPMAANSASETGSWPKFSWKNWGAGWGNNGGWGPGKGWGNDGWSTSSTVSPDAAVTPAPAQQTVYSTQTQVVTDEPYYSNDVFVTTFETFYTTLPCTTSTESPVVVTVSGAPVTVFPVATSTPSYPDVTTISGSSVTYDPAATSIEASSVLVITASAVDSGFGALTTFTVTDFSSKTTFAVSNATERSVIPSTSVLDVYTLAPVYTSKPAPPPQFLSATPASSYASPTSLCFPTQSPTFAPACTTSIIEGCVPCEGLPGNNPDTWCGLDITTNYYETWPITCRKVTCILEITNVTLYPDGVPRQVLAVNGKMPGDQITANWGDEVEVQVTNQLTSNGTSIHFHGVRQLNNNQYDGVPSITQCPIAGNGGTMTYTWTATQYGHSWYHSHYSLQAWEGVQGPLVINGPSSAAWDIDLGPVMIQDWLHTPVFQQFEHVERTGSPQQDNILINGVGVWGTSEDNLIGSRAQFVLVPGKKHRIQLICTALDSTFTFSIDNHNMTVIANDFVPIVPYTTELIKVAIGQRYDIIVEANQTPGDYWMRVDALDFSVEPGLAPPCGSPNTMTNFTMAAVHYEGFCGTPTTTGYEHDTICADEPLASLVPYLPLNVGTAEQTISEDLVITQDATTQIYRWYLSNNTFQAYFDSPTLLNVFENNTNYAGPLALETDKSMSWVYTIIETTVPLSHPIHLHGHDFYVLSAGSGSYTNQTLNLVNPPRRDVFMLPIGGYLVVGFLTDNPGVWLMHCHIGWHVSMGFALQFVESVDDARNDISGTVLQDTCTAYSSFASTANIFMDDSGV